MKDKELAAANLYDLSQMQTAEIKDRLKMELNMLDRHSTRAQAIFNEISHINGDKLLKPIKEDVEKAMSIAAPEPSMLSRNT